VYRIDPPSLTVDGVFASDDRFGAKARLFSIRGGAAGSHPFRNGSSWLLAVLKWAEVVVIWAQDHQREC
jgi:hypothetical protein